MASPSDSPSSAGGDAPKGRFAAMVESAFGALAVWAYGRPWIVLGLIAVSVLVAAQASRGLKVSADLAELLPKSFPSVQAVDELEVRVGGVGYTVVVVSGEQPEQLTAFADELAPKLTALKNVRYVEHKRPNTFFTDRGLYFLTIKELETIRDRIEARRQWEVRRKMPLYDLGLDDDDDDDDASDDDDDDASDDGDDASDNDKGDSDKNAAGDAEEGNGDKADEDDADEDEDDEDVALDSGGKTPPSLDMSDIIDKYKSSQPGSDRLRGDETYYVSKDGKVLAMFVKPDALAADLAFAKQVVAEVAEAAAQVKRDGVEVELTGNYKRKVEQQEMITRDLGISSTAALVMMVLFLALYSRRVRAVIFVIAPLLVGLLWTFAFAKLAFGVLNLMTAFLGAILLGLGIDHGIHLFSRYQAEATDDGADEEGVRRTFSQTGRAVAVAALTTTVGFAGLSRSEFRAFREFGIMAAVGTAFILLSYLLFGPALLRLLTKRGRSLRVDAKAGRAWATSLLRKPKIVLGVSLLIALGLASRGREASFNYDFAAVQGDHLRSFQLDRKVNKLLGRSQSPVAFLTDDTAGERVVAKTLRDRMKAQGDASTIDFVLSLSDLVPEDQDKKAALVQEIGDSAKGFKKYELTDDQRKRVNDLARMGSTKPFVRTDLPASLSRQMLGTDGKSSVVLAFPSVNQHDGREVLRLAQELRGIDIGGGETLRPAAESMILADVLHMVITESPTVLLWTTVAMFITLLLLMGRFRGAIVCLAVGGLTVVLTLTSLPLFGLQMNYLNVVVVPVLFGLAVDGSVHMVTRVQSGIELSEAVSETARAIFGALLTTALGFGALMLSEHPGLDSIGAVAVVGLAVNAWLTLVVLPAAIALMRRAQPAVGPPESD